MSDLERYKWMIPLMNQADKEAKRKLFKNLRLKEKNFFPKEEYHADVKNLISCMLCPNICRFDLELFKPHKQKQ